MATEDELLAESAQRWQRERKTAVALQELFIMLVKFGSTLNAVMEHLGLMPQEGQGEQTGKGKGAGDGMAGETQSGTETTTDTR